MAAPDDKLRQDAPPHDGDAASEPEAEHLGADHPGIDHRILAAWHSWLSALASDPEAAMAAAMAYEALDDKGRDLWLDALEQDAPQIDVPKVAIYAPLLSVENDGERRARIQEAVGCFIAAGITAGKQSARARSLRGIASNSDRLVALVFPLYLDFVQTIACRFHPGEGFAWVRHDPIVRDRDAPREKTELEGVVLERTPLQPVVDELAHAVLAHRRSGQAMPEGLRLIVDLFDPVVEDAV